MHNHEPRLTLAAELRRLERDAEDDVLAEWGIEPASSDVNYGDFSDDYDYNSDDDNNNSDYNDDDDDDNYSNQEDTPEFTFPPPPKPRHKSTLSQTRFHPLLLGPHTFSKLTTVFRKGLARRPPADENTLFMERFRYEIVSCRVLEHKHNTHNKHNTFKNIHREHRFWKGSGHSAAAAAVLAVALWAASRPGASLNELVSLFRTELAGRVLSVSAFLRSLAGSCCNLSGAFRSLKGCGPIATISKTRAAALVLGVSCWLLFYAYIQRRALRLLRLRALTATSRLVAAAHPYDARAGKCLAVLKEVDLLARGYNTGRGAAAFGAPLGNDRAPRSSNPIPAFVQQLDTLGSSRVMGKHLRATLAAGFYLLSCELTEAIRKVMPYCDTLDLDKYLEIYEMDMSVLADFGWGYACDGAGRFGIGSGDLACTSNDLDLGSEDFARPSAYLHNLSFNIPRSQFFGTAAATAPLPRLKLELQKAQFLRRVFLCCLLSVSMERGESSSAKRSLDNGWEKRMWTDVCESVDAVSSLMTHLQNSLSLTKVSETCGLVSPEASSRNSGLSLAESTDPSLWRKQMRSLNNIFASLQHIESRMEMVRDTSIGIMMAGQDDEAELARLGAAVDGVLPKDGNVPQDLPHDFAAFDEFETHFESNFEMVGTEIRGLLDAWEQGRDEFRKTVEILRARRKEEGDVVPVDSGMGSDINSTIDSTNTINTTHLHTTNHDTTNFKTTNHDKTNHDTTNLNTTNLNKTNLDNTTNPDTPPLQMLHYNGAGEVEQAPLHFGPGDTPLRATAARSDTQRAALEAMAIGKARQERIAGLAPVDTQSSLKDKPLFNKESLDTNSKPSHTKNKPSFKPIPVLHKREISELSGISNLSERTGTSLFSLLSAASTSTLMTNPALYAAGNVYECDGQPKPRDSE